MVSSASCIMKNIGVLSFTSQRLFIVPVRLISCIAFGSASSACYLLKSIAIIL